MRSSARYFFFECFRLHYERDDNFDGGPTGRQLKAQMKSQVYTCVGVRRGPRFLPVPPDAGGELQATLQNMLRVF